MSQTQECYSSVGAYAGATPSIIAAQRKLNADRPANRIGHLLGAIACSAYSGDFLNKRLALFPALSLRGMQIRDQIGAFLLPLEYLRRGSIIFPFLKTKIKTLYHARH